MSRVLNINGCGFFPTCPRLDYSVEPERYPIALPIAKAMRWYWKAKKWRVEFNLTRDGAPGTHTYSGSSIVTPTMGAVFGGVNPAREDYGVCYWGINDTRAVSSSPASSSEFSWQFFISDNLAVGYNALTDLWLPRFYFVVVSGFGGVNELSTIQAGGTAEATLNIDGESITLYKATGLPGITWSGTVNITIDEFWKYADPLGNDPVFDSVTGIANVDPFSRLPV